MPISLDHVSKHFGDLTAVDQLSLTIDDGEIFGLLGPNGAGKSTTVAMICGLLLPDQGEVLIAGASPLSKGTKVRIGLAPQSLALYEDLTANANLEFFGSLYGLVGDQLRQRIRWALEFVGLGDRAKQRVEQYSGGMKRRLNLAAALLHDPDYLLLDEPTVGVDPQSRNKIFDLILELRDQGKTIIYTTHYMEEAQRLCNRVGIIDQGKVLALGSVDELIRDHGGDSEVSITTASRDIVLTTNEPIKSLREALLQHSEIQDLKLLRPNLEKVFLNLTGRQLRD